MKKYQAPTAETIKLDIYDEFLAGTSEQGSAELTSGQEWGGN